jgi:hypothetical protein
MSKGVEEYNKIHPRIKLALYKVGRIIWCCDIEMLCNVCNDLLGKYISILHEN